jgi:predicted porin
VIVAGQQVRDATGAGTLRAGYVGGSYQFGALQLFSGFYAGRHSGNTVHKEVYTVSGLYRFGSAGALSLGYARVNDHAGGGNADQFSAMYRYSLSKRTELYATFARLNNHHRALYTLRGVNVVGIPPAFPGADMTGGQLGVLHRF